jgi:pre-mRNA-processing factor 40
VKCGAQSVPVMAELPEFKALAEDEHRRIAFDKHIQRMKVRCGQVYSSGTHANAQDHKAQREAEEAESAKRRERELSRRALSERAVSEDVRSRHGSVRVRGDEDVEMGEVLPSTSSRHHRKRSVSRERDSRRRSTRDEADYARSSSRRHRRSRSRESKRVRHESPPRSASRSLPERSPVKIDPADVVDYGSPPPEQKSRASSMAASGARPMEVDVKPVIKGEDVEEGEVA